MLLVEFTMDPKNSNPSVSQTGKRQRKETCKITDNADPLLPKNKKAKVPALAKAKATKQANKSNSRIEESEDEDAVLSPKDANNAGDAREVVEVDDEEEDVPEKPEESAEEQLSESTLACHSRVVDTDHAPERLSKDWNSPIYAFFKPIPLIDHINGRRLHIFECNAKRCNGKGQNGRHVRRYLDTCDAKSTSNLRRHTKICWGEETVEAASRTKDVHAARDAMAKAKLKDGSIMAVFERAGKDKLTFSHRQHTRTESR
jgi:hypothetical protein